MKINGFSWAFLSLMIKMAKTQNLDERSFSIELKTKQNLKNITLNSHSAENVLIEGTIGKLENAGFVSEDILEIVGSTGTLRVNIAKQELTEAKQP
jgi:hypothetical protein